MKKTSFVRKGAASSPSAQTPTGATTSQSAAAPAPPDGTRISTNTSQLLVSSGLDDLDRIIGGGLAVGTLALIEEDIYSEYSDTLLKYFLAEGVACKQSLYVACDNDDPKGFVQKLPYLSSSSRRSSESKDPTPDMKIAWQYKKYLEGDNANNASALSDWAHSFDLNKYIEASALDATTITYADLEKFPKTIDATVSDAEKKFRKIYLDLNDKINSMNTSMFENPSKPARVLRIGLASLASALWGSSEQIREKALFQFLHALRGLLRQSIATCVVTVPMHLFSQVTQTQLRHMSDYIFSIQPFSDSSAPVSAAFDEFAGMFVIRKVPRINSMVSLLPEQPTYTFNLKRKKLAIEEIHLGPEVSRTTGKVGEENKQKVAASTKKKSSHHGHDHNHGGGSTSSMLCQPGPPSQPNPLDF